MLNILDLSCGNNEEDWYNHDCCQNIKYIRIDKIKNNPNIIYWDAENDLLPINKKSIDVLYCGGAIMYYSRYALYNLSSEIKRVMKINSTLRFFVKGIDRNNGIYINNPIFEYNQFFELLKIDGFIITDIKLVNYDIDHDKKYPYLDYNINLKYFKK